MEKRPARLWLLVFWLVIVAIIGGFGSWVTLPNIPAWYAGLIKPAFTPPNGVFGPAWTLLYVMMAVAAWQLGRSGTSPQHRTATALFVLQLVLNALWSPVFFGLQAPRAGLAIIVALLAALLATVIAFWRVDRRAALLLVPYLLWVGYATALNAAIVRLN